MVPSERGAAIGIVFLRKSTKTDSPDSNLAQIFLDTHPSLISQLQPVMSPHGDPPPLNYYAARPLPRLSHWISVGFLLGLLIGLPVAGYVGYHAMWGLADVPILAGHRLFAGLAAVVFLILDLGFLRYVVLRLRRVQAEREAATAGLAGNAEPMTVCRRCGPFPTSNRVVVPAGAGKTWMMRAFSVVLLAAVVAFLALVWTDRLPGAVGSTPAVICTIVGINLWRYSRDPIERCPRCGSRRLVGGDTPLGRQLVQEWQLMHGAGDSGSAGD